MRCGEFLASQLSHINEMDAFKQKTQPNVMRATRAKPKYVGRRIA